MSSINFDNVWLLLIAVPILALLAIPFFVAVRKENKTWHNVTSSVLHVLIAFLVAFSAAGTSIETVVTKTKVYVLADVSYSANKNLDKIDEYIGNLSENLPQNTQLGVVCFGKDYEVLSVAGTPIRSVKEANVDDSGTDIVSAMNYVKNIYGNDVIKRLVVITDGKQSDESDPSALRSAVNELNAADILVDAIYLDDNLVSGAHEAQVVSVEHSQTAYKNRQSIATAVISSKFVTPAEVFLYRDGVQLAWEFVNLKSGRNYVEFELPTDAEGEFHYEIRLSAEQDENPHNNLCKFTQKVTSVVNVLLISDKKSDATAVASMLGSDATVTNCVATADIPYTVAELSAYDEIILSNVNLANKNNCDMFVDSLLSVVSKLGKSLITMGNLSLSGGNEGAISPSLQQLATKLPVDYANSARDSKLVTFVFDASDSMYNLGRLNRAKSAAKHIVSGLSEKDRVAIVYFHGKKGVQLSVRQLDTEENRTAVVDAIDTIEVKQGTMMSGGLEEAYLHISQLTGFEKQVVFMSDGMNSTLDSDEALDEWAKSLNQLNIPVSVIDVGRGSDDKWDDTWVQAAQRLKRIAEFGGGSYLLADTDSKLSEFVFPQITADVQDAIVDGQLSAVKTDRRFDSVLEGISPENIPYVSGYVNTGLRASATNVLSTEYRLQNGSTVKVPVYSYWKVGQGKIASFTSSFSSDEEGNWLEKWKVSDGENASLATTFIKNVIVQNTPTERRANPFTLTMEGETGYCSLTLAHVNAQSAATVKATVTAPDGSVAEYDLGYNSSVHTAIFATPSEGGYQVSVSYSYKGETFTESRYYYVSFLPEYDSFALYDAGVLYKMLDGVGTVSEDGTLKIEHDESRVELRIVRLAVPFMVAAVVLFAIDIIIRKLKWEDIRSLFKRSHKEKKS